MSIQTASFTVQQYFDASCKQVRSGDLWDPLGVALVEETDGMMCNGCGYFGIKHLDKCSAHRKLIASVKPAAAPAAPAAPKAYLRTVREESRALGISINEVRRRRMAEATSTSAA